MEKQYKFVRFRTASWKKLRRAFYGRKDETFSDYIERVAYTIQELNEECRIKSEQLEEKELKNG